MIDRLLHFSLYPLRTTDGGPSGNIAHNYLPFLSDKYCFSHNLVYQSLGSRVRRTTLQAMARHRWLDRLAGAGKAGRWRQFVLEAREHYVLSRARNYRLVYFHDVWRLKACLSLIPHAQVVLLQSYCPELPSQECAAQGMAEQDVQWSIAAEAEAFDRANVVIQPNSGVGSIYSGLMGGKRAQYVPYGALPVADACRYPLDRSTINFMYVGRRCHIKGFDIVMEAFREARKRRDDISLVVVGKPDGFPVTGEGVYDVGFSVRVHDWLASCDYLVSANRQSYVDMVILEALSVGTPIMMTMNAGHEIFRRQSSGIQEILNPYGLELQRLFLDPNLRKREDNYDAVRANKNLHVNSYTPADCARRLEDIACSLL